MTYADRVKDTTTTTGTGTITLSNVAPTGFQTFAAGLPASSTVPYCISSQSTAEWEVGNGVLLTSTTLSRSPTASSNAGGLVNFSAGTKDVFCTLPAGAIAKLLSSDDIAFATAIPFTAQGIRYMPQQTVASVLAFTAAASPVKNAQVYVRLVADAVNVPTFTGFKEWGGSLGYDNRNGIANQITFWYDGYDYWYSISQAVGAVAIPVAPGAPVIGAATGGNGSASVTFTVPASNGGATITTYTATSSPGGFTGTASSVTPITVTGLTNGTAYTFTVTATNSAGTGLASAASNSVTPAASTVAGAPTIGTATGGVASASVTFTAPGSNGGSAITSYTATSSLGGFTGSSATSPVTVTGLTNGTAYTFTVKANNANGASAASAASNSVTPAAAVAVLQFTTLANITQSGTSPNFVYTATSGATTFTGQGLLNKAFQSGVDGEFVQRVVSFGGGGMIYGVATTNALSTWPTIAYGVWVNSPEYQVVASGANTPATVTRTTVANDLVKIKRVGSTLTIQISSDGGTTYTVINTWTGISTGVYYITAYPSNTNVFDQLASTGLA